MIAANTTEHSRNAATAPMDACVIAQTTIAYPPNAARPAKALRKGSRTNSADGFTAQRQHDR